MLFPQSFFEDEVREGFFVSSKMKHFWAAQIEVMKQVEIICRKHGFTFYADYGTMLGAARHAGYIPWDDDLDLSMRREELDRFIPIARRELPEGFHVYTLSDENEFENLLVRVGNADYITFADDFMKGNQGCPYPVGVDIFPLDNVAPTPELEEKQLENMRLCFGMSDIIRGGGSLSKQEIESVKRLGVCEGVRFSSKYSLEKNIDLLGEHFARMYNGQKTGRIAAMGNYIHNKKYAIDEKHYSDVIYMPFETTYIPMAAGFDDILTHEYGQYMMPVRGGSAHDYPGYGRLDDTLIETLGGKWCGYKFEAEAINHRKVLNVDNNQQSDKKSSPERQMSEMLLTAQQMVRNLLSSDNPEGILELLTQCQSLALKLGERVEQDSNDSNIIQLLEKYCEQIFGLYTYLTDDTSPEIDLEQTISELEEISEKIDDLVADKFDKKKIVFLVSRLKYWNQLKSRYAELSGKKDVDCFIMVVPWYAKTFTGELGEQYYEKDDFPQDLRFLEYDKVSLEALHPDEIITQDHFGNTSASTSLHPYFYSERIWKYTDKLTVISPFIVDDFDLDDLRGCRSLEPVTNAPGTCWADEILVQSEMIRDVYIKNLTAFAGDNTRKYWDGIIKVLDDIDEVESQKVDSQSNQVAKDNTGKKTLCIHIGASVLLKNPDKSISKLDEIFNIFESNKEKLDILWWVDDKQVDNLGGQLGTAKLTRAFEKACGKIAKDVPGKIITAPNMEEICQIITISDAYYGDGSYAMNLFTRAKKPVMQMDL